jgi:hypothetical protein
MADVSQERSAIAAGSAAATFFEEVLKSKYCKGKFTTNVEGDNGKVYGSVDLKVHCEGPIGNSEEHPRAHKRQHK